MTLVIDLTTRKLHFPSFCKLGNYDTLTRSLKIPTNDGRHLIKKRDEGYHDGQCGSTGLEIFAFLLFLVYALDLLRNVLMNAMLNVMINDQTVTALQGKHILFVRPKHKTYTCGCDG